MAGGGTGRPIRLRCSKCRRDLWRHAGRRTGYHLAATGRTRPLPSSAQGRGGSRVLQYQVEYSCRECDYVGWTRHYDAERLLAAVTAVASQTQGSVTSDTGGTAG